MLKCFEERKDDSVVEVCHVPAGSKYYTFKFKENVAEDVMPTGIFSVLLNPLQGLKEMQHFTFSHQLGYSTT